MTGLPDFFADSTKLWFQETLGEPTSVQTEAWPLIREGRNTLASAPTGTGKTLTAFLVFLDDLIARSVQGTLTESLQVIYISPLKSLAADIRENLKRPLDGIYAKEQQKLARPLERIKVAIRTGDTTQKERQDMIKHPPHILITTPESLYLMLTSLSGRKILSGAHSVIIDEMHAMIDTKRGAHLMLSLARLDFLCERPLQRIGLSATIEPLNVAAEYLSPDAVEVVAPSIRKKVKISIISPKQEESILTRDSVWRDIAARIYEECQSARSVITFVQGRKPAEQLAMYMRELGGENFARVHHGSLSKEQRSIVEQDLKQGRIRLLIATSSMELGIDVGEIDRVFQVGLPSTISGTMQRLGRAGHSPAKTSVMQIYPRTSEEALYCGLTAEVARRGGIEHSKPPRMCLDILAQHLVSIAANRTYEVDEIMPVLRRAKPFCEVTVEDVRSVLMMLAGDYEHEDNIPVRPRLVYDRIHDLVEGDSYSRMLAVAAGGTIPDRGMFTVKTETGVKVGEVEEEFVFECRVGDEFQLGSFHWRVQKITKDTMFVIPSASKRDRLPFWKGDIMGRKKMTGVAFGQLLELLEESYHNDTLKEKLQNLGLDEKSAEDAGEYIRRQIDATEVLPNDKTLIVEHYRDEDGNYQMMVHSVFGNCVNAPLALLLQHQATGETKATINYVSDDDGIVLFSYDGLRLPEDLLFRIKPEQAKALLEILVPTTPTFNIMFRYNAGRALMMGISRLKRQPLWIQRIKGAQMLERAIMHDEHPLIRETKRECLEDFWDIDGLIDILNDITTQKITVREIFTELPSPMSFILRKKTEESLMYNYAPLTMGVNRTTDVKLQELKELLPPDSYHLERVHERRALPEDEKQLHTLLMIEGDIVAGEIPVPVEWLEKLMRQGQVSYIEPGLFIASEQIELYEDALNIRRECEPVLNNSEAFRKVILRLIRYRGGQSAEDITSRYVKSQNTFITEENVSRLLQELITEEKLVEQDGIFYYKELYERARTATVKSRRELVKTCEFAGYASYLISSMSIMAPPAEQLEYAIEQLCGEYYPAELWETVLLPARVNGYRPDMLDLLLSKGTFYWKMNTQSEVCFLRYEDADWDAVIELPSEEQDADLSCPTDKNSDHPANQCKLTSLEYRNECAILAVLRQRGACFTSVLEQAVESGSVYPYLVKLTGEGYLCTDSFGPVRYQLNQDSIEKMPPRQQVGARIKHLSAGRYDFSRPVKPVSLDTQINRGLVHKGILCSETSRSLVMAGLLSSWHDALDVLCIREYVGKVRRGYFVNGMSGIQYVAEELYQRIMGELKSPKTECRWISAVDPAQPYGKLTAHTEGRSFINVVGTCVAISEGRVVGVCEHKGKTLKIFESSLTENIVKSLAKEYSNKRILCDCKRVVLHEYPAEAAEIMKENGFRREMQDYVLYR